MADKFTITEEDIDRELDLLVENPNHGKRLSFIITEGDIDHELDLLLESPVNKYKSEITAIMMGKKLARNPLSKKPGQDNPAFDDAPPPKKRNPADFTEEQKQSVCAELTKFKEFIKLRGPDSDIPQEKFSEKHVRELIQYTDDHIARFGFCPSPKVEEDPCTGGRVKDEDGECRCPPGYRWVPAGGAPEATTDEPDRKPFRTLEEVDAAPTGEGEVIPPGAEGRCVKDEEEPCPEGQERNEDGECVDKEPQEKIDAEIEVFGWLEGSGGVTLVGGPKYKGGLPADEWSNLFAPQTSAYIDMFITYIFALSVIKKGNVIALDEALVSVDDFYKKVVIPAIEKHKPELITTLGTLTLAVGPAPTKMAGEEGYVDQQLNLHRQYIDKDKIKEVQEVYKNIGEKLKKEKKMLESKPGLAAKFNALRKQHHKPLKDELLKELIGKINGFIEKLTQSASKDEESTLQEGKIVEISIDFKELRSKQLDESFLLMFGTWVKWILQSMFGTGHIPGKIKGTKREIESFARTMGSEKKYIETARRFGLDHPTTYKNKAKLDAASRSFEKTTGIKWPFE